MLAEIVDRLKKTEPLFQEIRHVVRDIEPLVVSPSTSFRINVVEPPGL